MKSKGKQCDCKSYNAQIGTTDEVILKRQSWMPDGERVNGVPVDACIAPVIKHLWANGVITRSSCCGHNGEFGRPSIVLGEGVDNYQLVRKIIATKDDRDFELTQWKRVIV